MNAAILRAGREASQSVCVSRTGPRSVSLSPTRNGGWGGVSLSDSRTGKYGRSWFRRSWQFAVAKTICRAGSGGFEYSVLRARGDSGERRT